MATKKKKEETAPVEEKVTTTPEIKEINVEVEEVKPPAKEVKPPELDIDLESICNNKVIKLIADYRNRPDLPNTELIDIIKSAVTVK